MGGPGIPSFCKMINHTKESCEVCEHMAYRLVARADPLTCLSVTSSSCAVTLCLKKSESEVKQLIIFACIHIHVHKMRLTLPSSHLCGPVQTNYSQQMESSRLKLSVDLTLD